MAPRATENNAYAKFWGDKERALWYFMVFSGVVNRPFPSSPGPLFQNERRCSAFDMEIIFHSHANKTHFLKKGCAPSLILKVGVLELGSGLSAY